MNPCQNGGTCEEQAGTPVCTCPPGINGSLCDIVFEQLVMGSGWVCGLRSDQKVLCWGSNASYVPAPSDSFQSIAAGAYHACGVRLDGTVGCWGTNFYGQATPPSGTFTQVAAYSYGSCGIRTDGTVTCWGNVGTSLWDGTWPGTFQFISFAANFGCGVKTDGTLGCVGYTAGNYTPPSGQFSIVRAAQSTACGLRTDGTVACWGGVVPTLPSGTLSDMDSVDTGLRSDGTLVFWGPEPPPPPTPPSGTFLDTTGGWNPGCGIRTDHSVSCWGYTGNIGSPPSGQP